MENQIENNMENEMETVTGVACMLLFKEPLELMATSEETEGLFLLVNIRGYCRVGTSQSTTSEPCSVRSPRSAK